jgi:hypothetical protein
MSNSNLITSKMKELMEAKKAPEKKLTFQMDSEITNDQSGVRDNSSRDRFLNNLKKVSQAETSSNEMTTNNIGTNAERMSTNKNILSRIQTYEQLVEPTGQRNSAKPRDSSHRKQLLAKMKFSINNSYESNTTSPFNKAAIDVSGTEEGRQSVKDLVKLNEQRARSQTQNVNGRNTVHNMYNTAQNEIRDKIRQILEENDRDTSTLDLEKDEFMKEKLKRIGINEKDFKELVQFYNKHASITKQKVVVRKERNTHAGFRKAHSLRIPEIKEEEGEEETAAEAEVKREPLKTDSNDQYKSITTSFKANEDRVELIKHETVTIIEKPLSPPSQVNNTNLPIDDDSIQSGLSNESYFSYEDVAPTLVSEMENNKGDEYNLFKDYGYTNTAVRDSNVSCQPDKTIHSQDNNTEGATTDIMSKTKESDQKTSQEGGFTKEVNTSNNDISVDSEISLKENNYETNKKQIFEYTKKDNNVNKAKQAARAILMELNDEEDDKEATNPIQIVENFDIVENCVPEKIEFEIVDNKDNEFVYTYEKEGDCSKDSCSDVYDSSRLAEIKEEESKLNTFTSPDFETHKVDYNNESVNDCKELPIVEDNTGFEPEELPAFQADEIIDSCIEKREELIIKEEVLIKEEVVQKEEIYEEVVEEEIDHNSLGKVAENPLPNNITEVDKSAVGGDANNNNQVRVPTQEREEFFDDHLYGNDFEFRKSHLKKDYPKFELEDLKKDIETTKGHNTTSFKNQPTEEKLIEAYVATQYPIIKSNSIDEYKPRQSRAIKKNMAPLIDIRRLVRSEIPKEFLNDMSDTPKKQQLTVSSFENLKVDNSHSPNIHIIPSEPVIVKHNFNSNKTNKTYLEDGERLSSSLYPQRVDNKSIEIINQEHSKYQKNILHNLDSIAVMQYNINPNLPLDPMFFDILCINCYECVKPQEVDEHSEYCVIHPGDYEDLEIRNDCEEDYNARIYKLHESLKYKKFDIYGEDNNELNSVYNELVTQIYDIFMNNNSIEDLEQSITKINDIMNKKLIKVNSNYKYPLLIYAKRISQLVFTKLKEMEKLLMHVKEDDLFDDIIDDNKDMEDEDPEIAERLKMLKMELYNIEKQTEKTKMEVEQWRQEAKMRENMLARPSSNLEVLSDIVSDVLSRNNESVRRLLILV